MSCFRNQEDVTIAAFLFHIMQKVSCLTKFGQSMQRFTFQCESVTRQVQKLPISNNRKINQYREAQEGMCAEYFEV